MYASVKLGLELININMSKLVVSEEWGECMSPFLYIKRF